MATMKDQAIKAWEEEAPQLDFMDWLERRERIAALVAHVKANQA